MPATLLDVVLVLQAPPRMLFCGPEPAATAAEPDAGCASYPPGSWGPAAADTLAGPGGWQSLPIRGHPTRASACLPCLSRAARLRGDMGDTG